MKLGAFYFHQELDQVNFYKKSRLHIDGRWVRDGKVPTCLQLAQNWNASIKCGQNLLFFQLSQQLYDDMQNEINNLEFVQGVNFDYKDSLKNNGTKFLLTFDDSLGEICNRKTIFDIATAGRHRRFSTISPRHNLFHQNKLGRDLKLLNTHTVLFKSPRDVMQVSNPTAQLGLGSELVYWYRDATSLPYGQLLVDLSPRTDKWLGYWTNTGSLPSKFCVPERLKILKFWTMSTQNFLTLQRFLCCTKKFIPFLCHCITSQLKGNLQSIKRHHLAIFHRKVRLLFLEWTFWNQRRDILASEKG